METKTKLWSHLTGLRMLVLIGLLYAGATGAQAIHAGDGAEVIDENTIRGHVRFLADDRLEGRGPGSRGDELTQLYIATQFQTLGLQPAAGEGRWLQPFPLVGVRTIAPPTVVFRHADKSVALKSVEDVMSTIGKPV